MNMAVRIGIVVALAAAVGAVLVLKANQGPTGVDGPLAGEGAERLPRLVDLGSTTCAPCKAMAPILDEIRREYAGRLRVDFYDVKADPALKKPFDVRMIPTQIYYDAEGVELWRHEGFMGKDDILAVWEQLGIDLGEGDSAAGEPAKEPTD
ncbi:MAG: thioredoxin family protein [Planctomycetota bacterium]